MINLTTQVTELNFQNLDEEAKKRVETISKILVRKNDEMEVARTSIKRGVTFLDIYLELLTENGLDLKKYSAEISYQLNNKTELIYKLILKKI